MSYKISGIDEAGLGPLFGPLVLSSYTVNYPNFQSQKLLQNILAKHGIQMLDSKQIYRGKHKFAKLERLALLAMALASNGLIPRKLSHLSLVETELEALSAQLCYKDIEIELPIRVPLRELTPLVGQIHRELDMLNLSCTYQQRILGSKAFNQLIDKYDNKADVLLHLLAKLLAANDSARTVVDRLGQRKFYSSLLKMLDANKHIQIISETAQVSTYKVGAQEFIFQVKADQRQFESSIASICSKYLREIFMLKFNEFWASRGLPMISGYYADSRDFLGMLQSNFPEAVAELHRKR